MGALQRFERRLGGVVEGAFARVFKSHVEPAEVAAALNREAGDKKAVVGAGRVLVPNDYVVEIGPTDASRLMPYAEPLGAELAAMVRENAEEQGWSFVGPVRVRLEETDQFETGMFAVRSAVIAAPEASPAGPRRDPSPSAPPATPSYDAPTELHAGPGATAPRIVVSIDGTDRATDLVAPVTLLGRGSEADVRIADTSVSRRHAELRREGDDVILVDLGSTNGTTVNGRPVDRTVLQDGDVVRLGESTMTFRQGSASA